MKYWNKSLLNKDEFFCRCVSQRMKKIRRKRNEQNKEKVIEPAAIRILASQRTQRLTH